MRSILKSIDYQQKSIIDLPIKLIERYRRTTQNNKPDGKDISLGDNFLVVRNVSAIDLSKPEKVAVE